MMIESVPEPPVLGRRERQRRAMWDRLYTAAVELFTEHGYDATSIEDITERADVARGTFFNHFDRKDDVIAAWLMRRRETLREKLGQTASYNHNLAVCLEYCMHTLAQINIEEWRLVRVMLPAWVRAGHPIFEEPFLANLFAEIISAGQERGDVCADMDPFLAGNMLRELYLGTLYRYVGSDDIPSTLESELITILRITLLGLLDVGSGVRNTL